MENDPPIARTAALIGDPARASMLLALMSGGARTLSELATGAGLGLPTASAHVARLEAGGLIRGRKSGRHKYLELASPEVAAVIEHLMALHQLVDRSGAKPQRQPGPKDLAMREARLCYDHLAGARGVQMFQSLMAQGCLAPQPSGLALSEPGQAVVLALGLGVERRDLQPGKPELCRECLDWSQRQSHLAGRLGRLLLARMAEAGWISRDRPGGVLTRRLVFSASGERAFDRCFPTPSSGSPD